MSNTIYHYTSIEAFLSIIENQQLWASKIQYMNDSSEFKHGLNIIKDIYDKKDRLFFEYMKNTDAFVLSFSEKKDDLDQWRGYTKDGHGLCIGFSEDILIKQLEVESFFLKNCIYNERDQHKILKKLINEKENGTSDESIIATSQILMMIATFKNNAFKNEVEKRFINNPFLSLNTVQKKFRSKGKLILPFYELSIDFMKTGLLKEVIVGPTQDPILLQNAIRELLAQKLNLKGNAWNMVKLSKIPYRGSN